MIESSAFLKDPRRRNLAILAVIALVSVLLAVAALVHQASLTRTTYEAQTFFPGLPDKVRSISGIHVQSKRYGAFDIAFRPRRGWVLPQHGNYPASFEQMRMTVVGLAALQTIEPKTSRPEWYANLGVDAPPKGSGTLIQLLNDKGQVIASVIAGKTTDIGDASGAVGLYVRKPGDAQSWLARSVFEPKSNPSDWLDKNLVNIDRARIQEVDVVPVSGPAFGLKRASPADPSFALTPMPAGRALAYPGAADAVANAITGFAFDDVKSAADFDFAGTPRVITKTFDGLTVTVQVLARDGAIWAMVYAEGSTPAAAREARETDAHATGWAYKLPAYKGQLFMSTLDSLLKPLPPKK